MKTNDGPVIILVGNLSEGFKAYGPYRGFDKANDEPIAGEPNVWLMSLEGSRLFCQSTMDGDHDDHYECGLDDGHLGRHIDRLGLASWENERRL